MSVGVDSTSAFIIKRDALEDGIAYDVVDFIDSHSDIDILATHEVAMAEQDVLEIYRHELEDYPESTREILMAMSAVAMRGVNLVVAVDVTSAQNRAGAFIRLNQIKGTTNERTNPATVRGRFPYRQPEGFDDYSFWFRAPFFIRNRIHVPDSLSALHSLEEVVNAKGVTRDDLYPKRSR